MRRSHQAIIELVDGHTANFVNGDMSEAVLAASFKALHLSADEVKYYVWLAQIKKLRALSAQP